MVLLRFVIGRNISRHFFDQLAMKAKQTCRMRFPALSAGCRCLLWVMIGSVDFLCLLWLLQINAVNLVGRNKLAWFVFPILFVLEVDWLPCQMTSWSESWKQIYKKMYIETCWKPALHSPYFRSKGLIPNPSPWKLRIFGILEKREFRILFPTSYQIWWVLFH